MAVDPRNLFAAERTLLAWVRTGLAMMGFGFVVARFSLLLKEIAQEETHSVFRRPGLSLWIGVALVLLGVLVNVLAGLKYSRELQFLKRGEEIPATEWSLSRVVSLALAFVGVVMAVYLLALEM